MLANPNGCRPLRRRVTQQGANSVVVTAKPAEHLDDSRIGFEPRTQAPEQRLEAARVSHHAVGGDADGLAVARQRSSNKYGNL